MCGLTGYAATTPRAGDWLGSGSDALRHRGPDDAGAWRSTDGRVGLAHRRLSIIDLSPGGHQPMHDASGALTIVYNGEIYNYRELQAELRARGHVFASHSDTEVVLAAYREWGDDCLRRFNGMFAIVLHDATRQRVLLARDRAGEKPLFYRLADGELRFASELKALLADPAMPRRIDPEALDAWLAIGFVPGERCLLEGYRKLPPAHAAAFDLASGALRSWRYWAMPEVAPDDGDDAALLDEFESLLQDAVARQLVADVPVGVLLSGGVDSSLVTALASRSGAQVKTFTVGFAGSRYDEREHARLVAGHFGTEHVELEAGDAEAALLPLLARQYDDPVNDSSMIPTFLVSRLVREHCTVALGGDGGDELFGGYVHHSRLLQLRRRAGWIPQPLRAAVARAARALPTGFRGRAGLQQLGADLRRGLPTSATHFDPAARRALVGELPKHAERAEARLAARIPVHADLLQRVTRMDFGNYLPEDILVKVDRASMLNSLELRAPLLDHRVIEFAYGRVPSRLKSDGVQRKILLRRLSERVLPPQFDRQRKLGFGVPLAHWLRRGDWRELFHDVLQHGDTLFDRAATRRLLQQQDAGLHNYERLFGLVLLELWRREYRCTR